MNQSIHVSAYCSTRDVCHLRSSVHHTLGVVQLFRSERVIAAAAWFFCTLKNSGPNAECPGPVTLKARGSN